MPFPPPIHCNPVQLRVFKQLGGGFAIVCAPYIYFRRLIVVVAPAGLALATTTLLALATTTLLAQELGVAKTRLRHVPSAMLSATGCAQLSHGSSRWVW